MTFPFELWSCRVRCFCGAPMYSIHLQPPLSSIYSDNGAVNFTAWDNATCAGKGLGGGLEHPGGHLDSK